MDPQHSLQDVIRCNICEKPVPSEHCNICQINLCDACVQDHITDKSKKHYMMPFKLRGITPRCHKHPTYMCQEICKRCDIPICSQCVGTNEHEQHEKEDILSMFKSKVNLIQKDLQDLKKHIYPKFQKALQKIPDQKDSRKKYTETLKTTLNYQKEALHRRINTITEKMQSRIVDMDAEHMRAIEKQENAIKHELTEITHTISALKNLLDTKDACLFSKYISRNEEFRNLPLQFQVTLPTFTPQKINTEQIYQQVGSLTEQTITYPLIDEPRMLTNIQTDYGERSLRNVSCLSDSEFWTSGYNSNVMKLYNLRGELLKKATTKSGMDPSDIAVCLSGDTVYTDIWESTINLIVDAEAQTLITLCGWKPISVCGTSSGGLLVIMTTDDRKKTKVVRYSGTIEKQNIELDDQGEPLFSPRDNKSIVENRNLDVCVADFFARAVVVVSAAGKYRFRYTGHPDIKGSFKPFGITTDSHSKILIADYNNDCIHLIDQDGHLIRHFDNRVLKGPWGLCVDSKDNLFVAEYEKGNVKKIQYHK